MTLRCCLIGGGGFIGHHLIPVLLGSGRQVTVLDRKVPRAPIPEVEYVVGQYDDDSIFSRVLERSDELIDLAYATKPKTSFDDPLLDLLGNVPAAVALFRKALLSKRLRRIVFVSSGGTVYGPTESWPIPEDAPTHPISPYGITKLTIEKYAFMFHRTHGLPVLVVRPSNAYGPGQMPFTGQGFIATAIGSALLDKPLPLFGGGKTVRDYIYVDDLARGILAALDKGIPGEAYNLGTGVGLSNLEIVEALRPLAQAHGHELILECPPERGFDVPVNVLDIGKISRTTGWQPLVPFEAGLAQTWEAIAASLAHPE